MDSRVPSIFLLLFNQASGRIKPVVVLKGGVRLARVDGGAFLDSKVRGNGLRCVSFVFFDITHISN